MGEWDEEVSVEEAKRVLTKVFADGLILATDPNPDNRRAVVKKATLWRTKKTDGDETAKEEAKQRRFKISTSRANGQDVLRFGLQRTSSTWSVSSMSSTWSGSSGQSVLDRVRGLSSRFGNRARDLMGFS